MVALYRHFSKNGTLLYVGISSSHLSRLQTHAENAHWRDMIASVTIEKYPDRESAHAAEVKAIQTENPLFNKQHQVEGSVGHALAVLLPALDAMDYEDWLEDQTDEGCNEAA